MKFNFTRICMGAGLLIVGFIFVNKPITYNHQTLSIDAQGIIDILTILVGSLIIALGFERK